MDKYWVIVANSGHAYIYSYSQKDYKKWDLVYEMFHAPSRMKRMDLLTDTPGHPKSLTSAHGVYDEQVDVKEVEADHFAKEIAYIVNKNLKQLKFKYLIIAASQHFYSLLNKHLNKDVKKILKKIIKKDYSRLSNKGLEKVFFREDSPRKYDQRSTKHH